MKASILALLIVLLTACATIKNVDPSFSYGSSWSDEIIDDASKVYIHSIAAKNVYNKTDSFILPSYMKLVETDIKLEYESIGFSSAIYAITSNGKIDELVLAIAGTNGFFDALFGYLPIFNSHNSKGLKVYDELRAKNEYKNVKISVTGHSLGGGVAHYIAKERKGVDSFVFNYSPMFGFGNSENSDRIAFVSHGEFLKLFRMPMNKITQSYNSVSCGKKNMFSKHSMRPLAELIINIASNAQDTEVRARILEIIEINEIKPSKCL